MTADTRPPLAPIPGNLAACAEALTDRPRLFPSRLGPGQPRKRAGNLPPGDTARVWLLSRLWVQHAGLERRIATESARPRPDAETLGALKRERLAIRDRIAALDRRA